MACNLHSSQSRHDELFATCGVNREHYLLATSSRTQLPTQALHYTKITRGPSDLLPPHKAFAVTGSMFDEQQVCLGVLVETSGRKPPLNAFVENDGDTMT